MGYLFVNALLIATRKTSFSSTKEPPEEKTRRRGSNTGTIWITRLIFVQKRLEKHTLRSVNDVREGITQESPMGASWVLPRKVDKMV